MLSNYLYVKKYMTIGEDSNMRKIVCTFILLFIISFIQTPSFAQESDTQTIKVVTADGVKTITVNEDDQISVITKDGVYKKYFNKLLFINISNPTNRFVITRNLQSLILAIHMIL